MPSVSALEKHKTSEAALLIRDKRVWAACKKTCPTVKEITRITTASGTSEVHRSSQTLSKSEVKKKRE